MQKPQSESNPIPHKDALPISGAISGASLEANVRANVTANVVRMQSIQQNDEASPEKNTQVIEKLQHQLKRMTALLTLEEEARKAPDKTALQFLIANETRKVVDVDQILVWTAHQPIFGSQWKVQIETVSGIPKPDNNAPTTLWLANQISLQINSKELDKEPIRFILDRRKPAGMDYPLCHAILCSLDDKNNEKAGFVFTSDIPINSTHDPVIARLTTTYAHAWRMFGKRRAAFVKRINLKIIALTVTLLCLGLWLIPVPLSVMGQAEIVPADPALVAAPIEGVVDEIVVSPNSAVKKGDLLIKMEKSDLENRVELASRELELADAKYKRATQSSFGVGEGKRDLALLSVERELAATRLNHAKHLLEKSEIRAQGDGVALFSSPDEWHAKPVQTGEAIMQIANPRKLELRIELTTGDSISLDESSTIHFFPDSQPFNSINARFSSKSFQAKPSEAGILNFDVRAVPIGNYRDISIGERGIAQLSSEDVSLGYFLFRRPLSAIRQFFGL